MTSSAPEFQYDAFISYAHGDVDRSGESLLKTWSLAVARELEAELRTTPEWHNCSVFIDGSARPAHGLDSSDPLTQQLRNATTSSALLVILMSPHYLASDWCAQERSWWLERAQTEVLPEVGSRIIVARIWPTRDDKPWPRELCDEAGHPPLGVWLHPRPANVLTTRPFGWPDPTGRGGDFREGLVELSGQIVVRLEKLGEALRRRRQAATDAAKLNAKGGQAIYLHARMRDKVRWQTACHDLISAGYGVFPAAPESPASDPRDAVEENGENVRTLSGCDGLLLVAGDDHRSLVSDLAVIGHQRRNLARARSLKPLPCAVVDQGLQLETKQMLQQSARNLQIDWINAADDGWTGQIGRWLSSASADRLGAV